MPSKQDISELIATLSGGDFNALATKEIHRVIEGVEASGGTGKLSITIVLKKENRMVVAKPTVKATIPVKAVDASMYFVDAEGKLTEEDPKQVTLKFSKPAGKLVKLDGGSSDKAPDDSEPKKGN